MTDNPLEQNPVLAPKQLTPGQFAVIINKSTRTLRRWDAENLFAARRTPGNEPFYLEEDVARYFNPKNALLRV